MDELIKQIENDPNNINARMSLAKKYLEKEDFNNAIPVLKEIIALNENHLDALFILAQVCEAKEDYSEASIHYEKLYSLTKADDIAYKLASMYENSENFDKAYDFYKISYQKAPTDANMIERMAHISRILGKNNEAVEFYNELLKQEEDNLVALTQLMELYEDDNKFLYHLMNAKINKLNGALSHTASAYKKAINEAENEEDRIQVKYALAHIYIEQEKYLKAADEFQSIIEIEGDNFKVYKELANVYIELENEEAAKSSFENALEIYPENIEVLTELADLYLDMEEFESAYSILIKLQDLEQDNLSHKINLTRALAAQEKFEEAKSKLDEVLQRDHKNTEALSVFIDFCILKKDYNKAIENANKLIELIPKSPFGFRKLGEAYEALGENFNAHYNYGLSHDLKGEKQLAIDEFSWACDINPENIDLLLKLAWLYESTGEKFVSLEYYQKAYYVDKTNSFALAKVGDLYFEEKDYEQATNVYSELLTIDKSDKEVFFKLAKSYKKLKDWEKALDNYKQYIENAPNGANIENAKEKIKSIEKRTNVEENEGFLNKLLSIFSKG